MGIGERIKEIRKQKGLTQQAFADKLGLKRNTIGGYEIEAVSPSDRTVSDICRMFDVNEGWLRTGEGEMYVEISRDEQITDFISGVLKEENDDFRRRLISVLSRLDVDEWKLLERIALELAEE